MSRITLVIAGGDPPPADLLSTLPPPLITIAADSGINHAHALGVGVDVLVGDLDSADEASVQWAVERGAVVDVHPPDKDQTDLELALDHAVRASLSRGVDEMVVTGIGGGRLDHWLANLLTLAGPLTEAVDVTAYVERSRISVVRSRRTLTGHSGDLVSLIPVGGPVHGITTTGLEYPLHGETLAAGSSRGVSNRLVSGESERLDPAALVVAEIEVASGTLLAVQPNHSTAADPAGDGPDHPDPPSPPPTR